MSTHLFSDTSVMLGRSLRHVTRSMDTIITVTIMPIAFMLLFVYVFGGAIRAGSGNYVNYLMPGILLIAIASGIAYTAVRLFTDLQSGIFERFHSMPIARSSVLWAHVLTSLVSNMISVVVIVLVGLLIGFRSSAGVLAWLAVAGILVLFTLTLTWIAVIAGLSAKTAEGAGAFAYPIIFLPFISSAFVPTASMPAPVRAFAENQPVTSIVNTIRALFEQQPDRSGLVRRHPRRRLCVRHGGLPAQNGLKYQDPGCSAGLARHYYLGVARPVPESALGRTARKQCPHLPGEFVKTITKQGPQNL
jgi:ABC-2 type transport system permease protein